MSDEEAPSRGLGRRRRVHRGKRPHDGRQQQQRPAPPQRAAAQDEQRGTAEERQPERGAEERPAGAGGAAPRQNGERRPTGRVAEIAHAARTELEELVGRPVTSVLAVERRDGDWEVQLETVEVPRIPETTSLMGVYEVVLDESGQVLEFRRRRRYLRMRPDDDP